MYSASLGSSKGLRCLYLKGYLYSLPATVLLAIHAVLRLSLRSKALSSDPVTAYEGLVPAVVAGIRLNPSSVLVPVGPGLSWKIASELLAKKTCVALGSRF